MLLLGAALVSCEKVSEQDKSDDLGDQIRFSSSIGKYASKVADNAFEDGDVIGLTALEPINREAVRLTWKGGSFTPEEPIYWGKKQTEPTTFYAWYPYDLIRKAQPGTVLEVPTDQSKEAVIQSIDYLGALTIADPPSTVHLEFIHLMSRLNLFVRSEVEVAGVMVGGLSNQGFVDMEQYSIYAAQAPAEIEFTPLATGNGGYSLITLPQVAEKVYVKVIFADGSQTVLPSQGVLNFETGKQINGTVVITPAKEATFTAEIADWGQGSSAEFSSGTSRPKSTFYVILGKDTYEMEDLGDGLHKARIAGGIDTDYDVIIVSDDDRGYFFDSFPELEKWCDVSSMGYHYYISFSDYGNGTVDIYFSEVRKQVMITEFEAKPDNIGLVMDDLISDFLVSGTATTWPVQFETLIDGDADVYKVTGYPLFSPYASNYADSYLPQDGIILDGRNPEKAFIKSSPMGIDWGGYPIYFSSVVEENGYRNSSSYGIFENGEFRFPIRRSIGAYFEYYGDTYTTNLNGQTLFVLPGYERSTYFVSDAYPGIAEKITSEDGTKVQRFSINLYPDNTLLRVGVFEGWLYEEDEEAILSLAQEGAAPFSDYGFTPNETTYIDIALETAGKYTVATYTEGVDGTFYWWYRRFAYVPDGEEAPEFTFEVSDIHLSEYAPEREVIFTLKGEDISSVRAFYTIIEDTTELEEITEEDLLEITSQSSFFLESMENGEKTYRIYGLEPGCESAVVLELSSIYGDTKATYFTITTDPDPEWTSIGTGKYFDLGVPGFWYTDENYDEEGYSSPVEILTASTGNTVKYRVMQPFHALWRNASEGILEYRGIDPAEYFDLYLIPDDDTNYVVFSDYSTGFKYPGGFEDGAGTLTYHYYPAVKESPSEDYYASCCFELAEGVYGIAPMMNLEATRYYVPNHGWTNGIFVCLPGYDYTCPYLESDQTNGAPAKAKRLGAGAPAKEISGLSQPRIRPASASVTVSSIPSEKEILK